MAQSRSRYVEDVHNTTEPVNRVRISWKGEFVEAKIRAEKFEKTNEVIRPKTATVGLYFVATVSRFTNSLLTILTEWSGVN